MVGSLPGDADMTVTSSAYSKSPKTVVCQLWNFKTMTLDLGTYIGQPVYDGEFLLELKDLICNKLASMLKVPIQSVPGDLFRLVQCGKNLTDPTNFSLEDPVRVELRGSLKGGKGGFGSLLRSVKPKAQQDDNFEACRDLSGRRLRHINNERRIREF